MSKDLNNNFDKILLELIKERRSVRLFTGKKIPKGEILSIIEAGTWAPTGCNNQELRFFILDKEEEINDIIKFKPFLMGTSACVLIFCDMSLPMSSKMYCKSKDERHLHYIDTGLALENMIIYAKSKDIDSCILNLSEYHFKQHDKERNPIRKIIDKAKHKLGFCASMENNFEFYLRNNLKIPKHFKIMCSVAFGFAKKYPDINTAMHRGKKIMRKNIDYYIIHER